MAINIEVIKSYLKKMDVKFEERDTDTIVTVFSDDNNKVFIVIKLLEGGEFLQMRTVKHIDHLVAEADPVKRAELLKWMLNYNYSKKLGSWEYDPEDHDHHISISHCLEDNDLTIKQFARMLKVLSVTNKLIPEMKKTLGVLDPSLDLVEKKRQELLAQLKMLEDSKGI